MGLLDIDTAEYLGSCIQDKMSNKLTYSALNHEERVQQDLLIEVLGRGPVSFDSGSRIKRQPVCSDDGNRVP